MMRLLSLLFILAAVFAVWFVPSAWMSEPDANAPRVAVTIPANANVRDVARTLQEKGLITSAFGYRVYAWLNAAATRPKAGTYPIPVGMSYRALARMLATGPAREEIEMKIIEGWTLDDIGAAVRMAGGSWNAPIVKDWKADFPFLATLPGSTTLEGYLFPDTYRVWKDQLPESVIRKQLAAFDARTVGFAEDASKQGRAMHDVVILASIVEKEVANPDDRKIVAGIFWNRLKIGMALQSDATLNYITKSGNARSTAADLALESPYNTYKVRGLPPGPISNPGADALEAALHPAKTDYWYFLTDVDGKTYFARTLDEHARNRRRAFGR